MITEVKRIESVFEMRVPLKILENVEDLGLSNSQKINSGQNLLFVKMMGLSDLIFS